MTLSLLTSMLSSTSHQAVVMPGAGDFSGLTRAASQVVSQVNPHVPHIKFAEEIDHMEDIGELIDDLTTKPYPTTPPFNLNDQEMERARTMIMKFMVDNKIGSELTVRQSMKNLNMDQILRDDPNKYAELTLMASQIDWSNKGEYEMDLIRKGIKDTMDLKDSAYLRFIKDTSDQPQEVMQLFMGASQRGAAGVLTKEEIADLLNSNYSANDVNSLKNDLKPR